MLEQILDFIHNYFVRNEIRGTFEITGGIISVEELQDGQYFKIVGSIFNDGVYKYPAKDLTDEVFTGEIWAMAIPKSLLALVTEIEAWVAKYGDASNSPFQSESFGGYTYSKLSGQSEGNSQTNWQSVFKNRLNVYRKIS